MNIEVPFVTFITLTKTLWNSIKKKSEHLKMGHGGSSVLPQWEKAKRVLAVCKFLELLWIRQKKNQQKKNGSLGF